MRRLFIAALASALFCVSGIPGAVAATHEKHYRNDEWHFELDYPADLEVTANGQGEVFHLSFPEHEFYAWPNRNAGPYFRHTNLTHIAFLVNVVPSIASYECLRISGNNELTSEKRVVIHNTPFRYRITEEGAMGSLFSKMNYTTPHHGNCYSIELKIQGDNTALGDHKLACDGNTPDDKEWCAFAMKEFDPEPLQEILYHIVSTLKFTD